MIQMTVDMNASQNDLINTDANVPMSEKLPKVSLPPDVVKA
jgi:hypothetical protein